MAKNLSVLFVAGEAYPFAKETGVADVAFSLPLALRVAGIDVRAMIPKYGCVSDKKNKIYDTTRLKNIPIISKNNPNGDDPDEMLMTKSSFLSNSKHKVQLHITANDKFFGSRKGIYNEPIKLTPYADNLERFVFYCKSVLETCIVLGWYPDIIHCNDWQTALVPAYLKYLHPSKFKKTKTVLTIHNISDQGEFPISKFDLLGLPEKAKEIFTHNKKLNILKGGLEFSNFITTVSKAYLEQILKEKNTSNGLNEILKQNIARVAGIRNGIDVFVWNPLKDENISTQYLDNFEEYKTNNKIALCDKCAIEYDEKIPLIGMVARLNEQKGVDVVIEAIPELMKMDIQLVILGQGEAKLKGKLLKLQQKYNKKLNVMFAFDDAFAHLVEAGSDMFLMPSRQEACGLNMFYSLLYGSVPIVNLTGGIKDIAIPFDSKNTEKTANCFALRGLTAKSLAAAVAKAAKLFNEKQKWSKIVKNGMDGDYSWTESVQKYIEIYKKLIK